MPLATPRLIVQNAYCGPPRFSREATTQVSCCRRLGRSHPGGRALTDRRDLDYSLIFGNLNPVVDTLGLDREGFRIARSRHRR